MELVRFIFSDPWIWFGAFLMLCVVCGSITECAQAIGRKCEDKQESEKIEQK